MLYKQERRKRSQISNEQEQEIDNNFEIFLTFHSKFENQQNSKQNENKDDQIDEDIRNACIIMMQCCFIIQFTIVIIDI